jgi:hypothetical protein
MRAALLLACLAGIVAACAETEPPAPTLRTRVAVDRTEMRVGDAVGVTVEVETPAGFSVEAPATPPPDENFVTESLERLDPVALPTGIRHRLLWRLRARSVGDRSLPSLQVPLVWPDGRTQPLPVGSIPLLVGSVRDEIPERDVFFDVQPAPESEARGRWVWLGGGLALAGLVGLVLVGRRRRRSAPPAGPSLLELRRSAAVALEEALSESDPRRLARCLALAVWGFVERRFGVDPRATTPQELPGAVDADLRELLVRLEGERFRRSPRRDQVLRLGREARQWFGDVGRG